MAIARISIHNRLAAFRDSIIPVKFFSKSVTEIQIYANNEPGGQSYQNSKRIFLKPFGIGKNHI